MTETPLKALMKAWYTTIFVTTLLLAAIALWQVWDSDIFLRALQEGFTLDVRV
jgi:hypothetical protein